MSSFLQPSDTSKNVSFTPLNQGLSYRSVPPIPGGMYRAAHTGPTGYRYADRPVPLQYYTAALLQYEKV